jgi:hypothetical protein
MKASIHVYGEMLELCQVINDEGRPLTAKTPDLKWITFGEIFNVSAMSRAEKKEYSR